MILTSINIKVANAATVISTWHSTAKKNKSSLHYIEIFRTKVFIGK